MQGLYIASTHPRSGKTLVSCSLGVLLQRRGYKLGYMKPIGEILKRVEAGNGDSDALIVQEVLGQYVLPEVLTPLMIPSWSELILTQAEGYAEERLEAVKKSYAEISNGKDLMLLSGTSSAPFSGSFAGMDSMTLVKELDLKVILVERYESGINFDSLLFMNRMLEGRLVGCVLNDIPPDELPAVENVMEPFLRDSGVEVLGLVPHDPRLNSIRSLDLAFSLGGRIVAGNRNASNLVEGFLIGTMQVDSFMTHLRGNPGSAVIVGGDRADLQLAALHGKCPCLILTGNIGPHELVRTKAEEVGIPIIVAKEDSYEVARSMSRILKGKKFHELAQIQAGVTIVNESLRLDLLLEKWLGK